MRLFSMAMLLAMIVCLVSCQSLQQGKSQGNQGAGEPKDFNASMDEIDQLISKKNYPAAQTLLERMKKQEIFRQPKDDVLYNLEYGYILYLQGSYEDSLQRLNRADEKMEELYTKSVTVETAAFVTGDYNQIYEGEDFEKVMVNIIKALNYLHLGDFKNAQVEAKKIDEKLNYYNDKYETKSVYREDAFGRYLSGIIYEMQNDMNNARVAYKKALEIYKNDYLKNYGVKVPDRLVQDLINVNKILGQKNDVAQLHKEFPHVKELPTFKSAKQAEIIVFVHKGLPPIKKEEGFEIPVPQKGMVKVAFPKFEARKDNITHAVISISSEAQNIKNITKDKNKTPQEYFNLKVSSVEVENISAIAIKDLDDRALRVRGKAILRATTKAVAAKAAADEMGGGEMAQFLTQVVANVTEQSDLRSWRLLPGSIQIARLSVPAGKYDVSAQYFKNSTIVIPSQNIGQAEVGEGKKIFLKTREIGK